MRKYIVLNEKGYPIFPIYFEGDSNIPKEAIEITDEEEVEYLSNRYFNKESGKFEDIPLNTSLKELKVAKLAELKLQRDTAEVLPIQYNGNSYDYDEKARDRINAAIIALELQGEHATIEWTLADNGTATVTANDLKGVIASVAARSNTLHVAYRNAKEKVEKAVYKEELDAIALE